MFIFFFFLDLQLVRCPVCDQEKCEGEQRKCLIAHENAKYEILYSNAMNMKIKV